MENNYLTMHVTSPFSERPDPFTGKLMLHPGVDFTNKEQIVYAGLSGSIRLSGSGENGEGLFIQIRGKIKGITFYCNHFHNTKNYVIKGDKVTMNDDVGLMGDSGKAIGKHIHLEICTYSMDDSFIKKLEKLIPFIKTPKRIYFDPLKLYEYLEKNNIGY